MHRCEQNMSMWCTFDNHGNFIVSNFKATVVDLILLWLLSLASPLVFYTVVQWVFNNVCELIYLAGLVSLIGIFLLTYYYRYS